ncbi:MAG: 1,4-alpha-glucan branching protein GlgB [Chitinophagales bacterium]|nr:1,4-alpha-glucan branching protein GlgB [Chitinophagales bacterium]
MAKKAAASKKDKALMTTEHLSRFTEYDIHLFREGKHYALYDKLGCHKMEHNGAKGYYFAVWAPNAQYVAVVGDFNEWNKSSHAMHPRWDGSGIWEVFVPEAQQGHLYKYWIESRYHGYRMEKSDPYAFRWETPPNTASVVWDLDYAWNDHAWMEKRKETAGRPQPYLVYEMHIGSWKRVPEDGLRSLSYRELKEQLPPYLTEMGYTHVEFMPVMEHPFYGSWGYQVTGYFAPSSRYGSPQEFMELIEALHQTGIGVILDWVPSHFPADGFGLVYFDGTHLYEHADKRKGYHPDWQSMIFNYGRNEVKSFLISNALFWLDKYHADGLRVDAVASMLYLDYSRKHDEWLPNKYGGRENLEAMAFLREFNIACYSQHTGIQTIAEESTAWPMVSRPTYIGGLGFGMKWMMGWMHDTLDYFHLDPVFRQFHQNQIAFSIHYAFHENFMLPLSHDEVVYGKGPLIDKMPGDEWQKFANLRALYGYMYAHPGAKLLFMGGEFAQTREWNHDSSLDWHLLELPLHRQMKHWVATLNHLSKNEPALYELMFEPSGFEWIDLHDAANSVISFLRRGSTNADDVVVIVCNFTPIVRENYRIGLPYGGQWQEVLNSDGIEFGGSGIGNNEALHAEEIDVQGRQFSVSIQLPPLGVIYLKRA